MKKLVNFLLVTAIALGFVACNNDLPNPQDEGTTHVGVVLNMNASNRSEDYNPVGTYVGKDSINSVAVYIVDVAEGTVFTGDFHQGDFTIGNDGNGNIQLKPKKAIKATPGEKRIYALINGTQDVVTALAKANAADFEAAYKTVALKLENDYHDNPSVQSSASNIAKVEGNRDFIVMTNAEASTLTVAPNVTEEQAMDANNPQNRAIVKVKRAVARVMVTIKAESFEVKRSDGVVLGNIKDITWVLAQGENSLFIQQNDLKKSPKYDWVPTTEAEYYNPGDNGYDYSGLFENHDDGTTHFGGTTIPTLTTYVALNNAGDNQADVLASLGLDANAVNGKFILPTTHAYGDTGDATGYKKGNTAYVLVRARFTPAEMADGTTYVEGNDFYMGANGLFYSTANNAQNPTTGGIAGQTVARYVKGKVLYYAWVNPDAVPGWLNSPVLRNNIYHIHITGFKNVGTNWNPLVPNDNPGTTTDDFFNPDPKPENEFEPNNPIDPEDPLTTPETWMSVEISVLPWQVHSYQVDLGI